MHWCPLIAQQAFIINITIIITIIIMVIDPEEKVHKRV